MPTITEMEKSNHFYFKHCINSYLTLYSYHHIYTVTKQECKAKNNEWTKRKIYNTKIVLLLITFNIILQFSYFFMGKISVTTFKLMR